MDASDWLTVAVAALGIAGTLSATVIAHVFESRRAARREEVEERRAGADRADTASRERRDAIRSDYREVLRFVASTRAFVSELDRRLGALPVWTATLSSDHREVEDLEARALMFRDRMHGEFVDIQALVGVWGPTPLQTIFDKLTGYGPRVAGSVSVAMHLKVDNERLPAAMTDARDTLQEVLTLLEHARDLIQGELSPTGSS